MYPHLGATGSAYARSVVPTHTRDINLPDPGLIFDSKITLTCTKPGIVISWLTSDSSPRPKWTCTGKSYQNLGLAAPLCNYHHP